MADSLQDWRAIQDDKEKYAAYLCSREWSVLKNAVRDRCGGNCERCGRNAIDAVHHLTYARKYCESLDDLQGICNGCHQFTHGKSNIDPTQTLEPHEIFGALNCTYADTQCPYCGKHEWPAISIKEVFSEVGKTGKIVPGASVKGRYDAKASLVIVFECSSGHDFQIRFETSSNGFTYLSSRLIRNV